MKILILTALTTCLTLAGCSETPPATANGTTTVTTIHPNLWGTTKIEQSDNRGNRRSVWIQPNLFGKTTVVAQSNY
jgi:hypothetical protein